MRLGMVSLRQPEQEFKKLLPEPRIGLTQAQREARFGARAHREADQQIHTGGNPANGRFAIGALADLLLTSQGQIKSVIYIADGDDLQKTHLQIRFRGPEFEGRAEPPGGEVDIDQFLALLSEKRNSKKTGGPRYGWVRVRTNPGLETDDVWVNLVCGMVVREESPEFRRHIPLVWNTGEDGFVHVDVLKMEAAMAGSISAPTPALDVAEGRRTAEEAGIAPALTLEEQERNRRFRRVLTMEEHAYHADQERRVAERQQRTFTPRKRHERPSKVHRSY